MYLYHKIFLNVRSTLRVKNSNINKSTKVWFKLPMTYQLSICIALCTHPPKRFEKYGANESIFNLKILKYLILFSLSLTLFSIITLTQV